MKTNPHTTEQVKCDHEYAVSVKLLDRFYKLYEDGKKQGAPKGYVEFFAAQHFVLDEVEKAITAAEERERERIRAWSISELGPIEDQIKTEDDGEVREYLIGQRNKLYHLQQALTPPTSNQK